MPPKIAVYTAAPDKFFVNSFILESETGLVVVDTQFLVSGAKDLSAGVDARKKSLAAIVITHPHPDHYNGLPILLEGRGPVPVYANAATTAGIAATQAEKRAAWTPVYGDDYPTADALPDHVVEADATLDLAGMRLRLLDLRPGECADNTVIHLPEAGVLIASDLIYSACHPWLAEHRTGAWLRQLDEVQARFASVGTVFPGHGPAGDPSLFDAMRDYITGFRAAVKARMKGDALSDDAVAEIVALTVEGRDGWPLEGLVAMNAKAVAQELAAGG
jgi:glyoxylase-like metal-dependent hydrolase (beta-lactamase superfamily II)